MLSGVHQAQVPLTNMHFFEIARWDAASITSERGATTVISQAVLFNSGSDRPIILLMDIWANGWNTELGNMLAAPVEQQLFKMCFWSTVGGGISAPQMVWTTISMVQWPCWCGLWGVEVQIIGSGQFPLLLRGLVNTRRSRQIRLHIDGWDIQSWESYRRWLLWVHLTSLFLCTKGILLVFSEFPKPAEVADLELNTGTNGTSHVLFSLANKCFLSCCHPFL